MKKTKPKTLDKKFDINRGISWSCLSSFLYNKEQWYKKYVLDEAQIETPELRFGKAFATSIEDGTCEVKDLLAMLQKKKEHKFEVMFGDIKLLGYADAFCDQNFDILDEVKTGKKAWDQKRVDEHNQFDMYLLMNWITNGKRPSKVRCRLYWLPTQDNGDFTITLKKPVRMQVFETSRTDQQVLEFAKKINRLMAEMVAYRP